MTTPKQVAANRRNARMSTGPKTASGKAQSRRNALVHGLTARVLLDDEDPEGFEALRQSLWELKKPVGPLEEQILGNIAQTLWRKFCAPACNFDPSRGVIEFQF